jgi:SM-20-related protein
MDFGGMNVVIRHDVLPPFLTQELRRLLCSEELFIPATVTGDASWRSGRIVPTGNLGQAAQLVADAICARVPSVAEELGFRNPPPRASWHCEVQLSSYGDGDYFRLHNDNSTPDASGRWLSWVHYLDAIPGEHNWTGGHLMVEDAGARIVVQPADGETVFFPASALHEVTPVSAPHGWTNRRFSVNGWVRGDAQPMAV